MVERKNIVVLDLDGVLVNSQLPILAVLNELLGKNYDFEEWISYYWPLDQALLAGIDKQEAIKSLFDISVTSQGKPFLGVKEELERLIEHGFDLRIFTARPKSQKDRTVADVEAFFPNIFLLDNINLVDDTSLERHNFKAQILDLDLVAFIDDRAETIQLLIKLGLEKQFPVEVLRLLTKPWNTSFTDLDPHRNETFTDFVDWVIQNKS